MLASVVCPRGNELVDDAFPAKFIDDTASLSHTAVAEVWEARLFHDSHDSSCRVGRPR